MADASARLTVSIPTFNRADLLAETIRSVLDQSFTDIEVFISDNASTDNTAEVVASIGDPRLHYSRNDTNIGVHGNLARSLRLGSAPLLTVLPDDDLLLPGSLERKVALLDENPNVGIVHSASQLFHVGADNEVLYTHTFFTGGHTDTIEAGESVLRRLLSDDYWINFPATVIRRSVIGDVRFEPADGMADDLGVFLRLTRQARAVAYIAEPLVALRMHAEAHSTQMGFHEFQAGAFHSTFVTIAHIKNVRHRFLRAYGHELEEVKKIRATSRSWMRKMLLQIVQRKSRRDQSPIDQWRLMRQAAKVEPTVLLMPGAVQFLVKGLIRPAVRKLERSFPGVYSKLRPK